MKTKILNYRVVVEKENQKGKDVFVAYAPSLGISDFGESIEKAKKNLSLAIDLYLETLVELKRPLPTPDSEDFFVTSEKVELKIPSKGLVYC